MLIYLCDSFSSLAGYSTAFTVKELNEDELNKLQRFATTIPDVFDQYCGANNIPKNSRQLVIVQRLFLGLHGNAANFKIFDGERMLLLRVANWTNEKVRGNGPADDFLFFSTWTNGENRIATTKTIVGNLFTANEKAIQIRRTRKVVPIVAPNDKRNKMPTCTPNCESVFDEITLKKYIVESGQMRLKDVLKSQIENNTTEKMFMEKCGVKDLETVQFGVNIDAAQYPGKFDFE